MSSSEPPSQPLRLYSLQEANSLLPLVREVVARLQEIFAQFRAYAERESYPASLQQSNGHPLPAAKALLPSLDEVQALRAEAEQLINEVVQRGIALKDVEQGLVDFPAVRDGRVVFLCWKQGEDEIRFWHELDTGFAGRQPL